MSGLRRRGDFQDGISAAERIGDGFQGERIGNVLAVHHKAVFITAGREHGFLPPMTLAGGVQGFGFRLPMVKSSRDTNAGGGWMCELEADWLQLQAGAGRVVVVVIMFHKGDFMEWMISFFEKILKILPDTIKSWT